MTDIQNLDTGENEPLDRRRQHALDMIYGAQPASDDDFLPVSPQAQADQLLHDAVGPAAPAARYKAQAQTERAAATDTGPPTDGSVYPPGHITTPPIDSVVHRARMQMVQPLSARLRPLGMTEAQLNARIKKDARGCAYMILGVIVFICVVLILAHIGYDMIWGN